MALQCPYQIQLHLLNFIRIWVKSKIGFAFEWTNAFVMRVSYARKLSNWAGAIKTQWNCAEEIVSSLGFAHDLNYLRIINQYGCENICSMEYHCHNNNSIKAFTWISSVGFSRSYQFIIDSLFSPLYCSSTRIPHNSRLINRVFYFSHLSRYVLFFWSYQTRITIKCLKDAQGRERERSVEVSESYVIICVSVR